MIISKEELQGKLHDLQIQINKLRSDVHERILEHPTKYFGPRKNLSIEIKLTQAYECVLDCEALIFAPVAEER